MDSLDATTTLSQFQNLDPASKLEIQKVIEQESQKAELQKNIHKHADMCFKKCIGTKFGASQFERGEGACVQNCVDRFFDSHLFIILRLQNRGQH